MFICICNIRLKTILLLTYKAKDPLDVTNYLGIPFDMLLLYFRIREIIYHIVAILYIHFDVLWHSIEV